MLKKCLFPFLLVALSIGHWALAVEVDPLNIQIGEKLFQDDRFSHNFFKLHKNEVNIPVFPGDPVLEELEMPGMNLEHPLRGQQMSCAGCHLLDQATKLQKDLVLAFNDMTWRTLVPQRNDDIERTLRNSQNLVGMVTIPGRPLHWDGEFNSAKELSCAGLQGRNMGWLVTEGPTARAHAVSVLRKDDGSYPFSYASTESYENLFKDFGVDIKGLSDQQLLDKACHYMGDFLADQDFKRDRDGLYIGSAYDKFLKANKIRRAPMQGESQKQYLAYLKHEFGKKRQWQWVQPEYMKYHKHQKKFGPEEFTGLQVFFNQGKCAECHRPPEFTDFGFHNIGITQMEYDFVYGNSAFSRLKIPSYQERLQKPEESLTPTEKHPNWKGSFARIPNNDIQDAVDLGLWNVLYHPDKPLVQTDLKDALCETYDDEDCWQWDEETQLEKSIGLMRTPTLRSLGQTAPYFHSGMAMGLREVLARYFAFSRMADQGILRNGDPKMKEMNFRPHDIEAMELFLQALDEDFDGQF